MLCALNDFYFKSDDVALQELSQTKTYQFESINVIGDFSDWQATGKWTNEFSIAGVLIKKNINSLVYLETLADKKQVVNLVFETGVVYPVLIMSITTNKSNFLNNGYHLKQDFEVSLQAINKRRYE